MIRLLSTPPVLLIGVFAASHPGTCLSQAASLDSAFERIAIVLDAKMKQYGIPGAALGISSNGTRLTRAFGFTSVENPLPVTEATFFQIGSITNQDALVLAMRVGHRRLHDGR